MHVGWKNFVRFYVVMSGAMVIHEKEHVNYMICVYIFVSLKLTAIFSFD